MGSPNVIEMEGVEGLLARLDLSLSEAAALSPTRRNRLIRFLIEWERFEDARQLLEPLVEIDPDGIVHRVELCRCWIGTARLEPARELARAIYADPRGRRAGVMLAGELHLAEGRADRAEAAFRRCTVAGVLTSTAQRRIAAARLRGGDLAGAAELIAGWRAAAERNENGFAPSSTASPTWLRSGAMRELVRLEWLLARARDDIPGAAAAEARLEAAFRESLDALGLSSAGPGPDGDPVTNPDHLGPAEEADNGSSAPPAAAPARCLAVASSGEHPGTRAPGRPTQDVVSVSPGPSSPSGDSADLTAALRRCFEFPSFRPGQAEIISALLGGTNVLGVMPTGAGKSICFQLPAMLLERCTVVISPLIALMKDQVDGLPPAIHARATLVNSMLEAGEAELRLAAAARGEYSLVYAAPERLRQRPFVEALRRAGVSLFVVDEAHCVSLWGHDFRPDYFFLGQVLRDLSLDKRTRPRVLALTATATPEIQADIARRLGVDFSIVNLGTYRPNLALEAVRCRDRDEKWDRLLKLCRAEEGAAIVYVDRRQLAENLAFRLCAAGIPAGFYHAGIERSERDAAQDDFMTGKTRVVVATIAFGMGIDKADIRLVVHFNLPKSLEDYHQQTGRAGRDGHRSRCVLLFTAADKALLTRRDQEGKVEPEEVERVFAAVTGRLGSGEPLIHLDDLERDLELEETRLRVALSALEQVGALRRGYDVPRTFSLYWNGRKGDDAFSAFVAAARLRPRQRLARDSTELAEAAGISLWRLEERLLFWQERGWLEARGSGRALCLERVGEDRRDRLEGRIRQLLGQLRLHDRRRLDVLYAFADSRGCRPREIARHFSAPLPEACGICDNCVRRAGAEAPAPAARSAVPYLSPQEAALLERLRHWRMQEGRRRGVPAQKILSDNALHELARARPANLYRAAGILGPALIERYGETLGTVLERFAAQSSVAEAPGPAYATMGVLKRAWEDLRRFWNGET